MTERPTAIVEYGAFQQPPNALFCDYLVGRSSAPGFYEGGRWDLQAVAQAASRTRGYPHPSAALSEALAAQQLERGANLAGERARALADPASTVVVTGQQAGLFGGPLFVLYKAMAARRVAAALQAETKTPVVPVFWVASDDHDFAEVRTATVLDETGRPREPAVRAAPRACRPTGVPDRPRRDDHGAGGRAEALLAPERASGRNAGAPRSLLPPRRDPGRRLRTIHLQPLPGPRRPRPLRREQSRPSAYRSWHGRSARSRPPPASPGRSGPASSRPAITSRSPCAPAS